MELYFDHAATTPLHSAVKEAMVEAFDVYGNPSSLHRRGIEAENLIRSARAEVQKCLGRADTGRLIFTGSGTEANNLAIFGTAIRYQERGRHLVTLQVEHPAVLEPYKRLEQLGWKVTYVPPKPDGTVSAKDVLNAVTNDTVLVSVMHVNNETGAIMPVHEIGQALAQRPKTLFHVDGTQAFGKIENCARVSGADLYVMSAHKIGGPKGIGALWLRTGLEIDPLTFGGGQEHGLRSGTENVIGIVGFGAAAKAARQAFPDSFTHVTKLCNALLEGLTQVPGCEVNRPDEASPYVVNALFPGHRGEVLLHALESEGLYVSTGSACSTRRGHTTGSHVLKAMGKNNVEITGAIRFSLARWQTEEEIRQAVQIVQKQMQWMNQLL